MGTDRIEQSVREEQRVWSGSFLDLPRGTFLSLNILNKEADAASPQDETRQGREQPQAECTKAKDMPPSPTRRLAGEGAW